MLRNKSLLFVVALSLLLVARFGGAADVAAPDSPKPTLVINLTSGEEDLHAVSMGLHFAQHGLDDGREVAVFFNVKSPPLARKDLAKTVRFKDKTPIVELIASLHEQGATLVVCPMCAEITGISKEELAEGIQMIEDRSQIFDYLHSNSVVFTY